MSYCSINEAWQNIEQIDHSQPVYPEDNIKEEVILQHKKEKINCKDVVNHIKECKECQNLFRKKNIMKNSKLQQILFNILIGILVIFVLDIFVKIGKFISKHKIILKN